MIKYSVHIACLGAEFGWEGATAAAVVVAVVAMPVWECAWVVEASQTAVAMVACAWVAAKMAVVLDVVARVAIVAVALRSMAKTPEEARVRGGTHRANSVPLRVR